MRLPYFLAPGQPRTASIPYVKIVYKNGSQRTTPLLALVDSGAQVSFAPLDVALWLGIRVDKKHPLELRGFNNAPTTCYPGPTTIEIDGREFDISIYYGGAAGLQCILGQDPFFDFAKITFERYNNTFSIDWLSKQTTTN